MPNVNIKIKISVLISTTKNKKLIIFFIPRSTPRDMSCRVCGPTAYFINLKLYIYIYIYIYIYKVEASPVKAWTGP
jgi:hypothetical protein